ncbi:C40 family peptidase [Pseudolactococcus reticulitermitis]|nr:C40 family peptidase [Lactococcus reticulitermitis]
MLKKRNNKIKLILTAFVVVSAGFGLSAKADEITAHQLNLQDNLTQHQPKPNLDYFMGLANDKRVEKEQVTVKKTVHEAEKATVPPPAPVKTREEKLVATANRYQGVPYVYGGTTPDGFDCSGFTSYVYREALGQEIGRMTWNQMAVGQQISVDDAKVGDLLVFFGGNHVGIYLGNGQFIHAPQPGDIVSVSSLATMPADFALRF